MAYKCFGCGKFIKLGEGKVTRATDPTGFIQDFCEVCVAERLEFIKGEKGMSATFADYIGLRKTIEIV